MEPLSKPEEGLSDTEENEVAPEGAIGGEEIILNDMGDGQKVLTNSVAAETKQDEAEQAEEVPKEQETSSSTPDTNETIIGASGSEEEQKNTSISTSVETSAKFSPEEISSTNNSHSETEPKNRPRIDTPDVSMEIYSMNQPPTTPLLSLVDDLDLKTPMMGTSPSLEIKSSEGESSTSPSTNGHNEALHESTPMKSNGSNTASSTLKTPSSLFHAINDPEESSMLIRNPNATTPSTKKASNTSKTLAALFGGPSIGSAPGDYSSANLNNLAAQHDYTLVGDSPYETTYDPQSAFYYNRVYGQLYITTISVMFRGKAFGPIGAIPYERRLLLPFLEISEIHAYKTTSVRITMNDSESYVFKGFTNREAMVKLLRRTKRKCNELYKQRRHTTTIVPATMSAVKLNSESSNVNDTSLVSSGIATSHIALSQTNERQQHRRSRTPNSIKDKGSKHSDLRRRSQSMPSSLREAKAARASSKSASTTPQRNSVFSEDETMGNKENSDTVQKTSEKMLMGTLTL